ncbi:amino acid ABC transporter permease [Ramlibacter albus]|uniref:Amino acid ABC transporter permease n=1 Tax=Ramlibacter albus TaxID=2079448 RepID=A0A923S4P7_9BURK|nr:amino acid ABC transporter permease [Ramlibacter albus]MBC5767824.1 amino acid ABC transporter permease [Ramlibacter albus]
MEYQWDFALMWTSLPVLVRGVGVMAQLWVGCFVAGLAIGFLVCLMRLSHSRVLGAAASAWVEVFRNVPALIQLIWFFYAFPVLIDTQLTPFVAAFIGIALNTSAYCAEIFRAGIQSMETGQWEGAAALGMTRRQAMRRIILPQVFHRMIPAFTNRGVELAKVTSLASVLSVHELMYQGRLLSATYYRPLEIFTAVALTYFVVIYPFSYASHRLEQRLGSRL